MKICDIFTAYYVDLQLQYKVMILLELQSTSQFSIGKVLRGTV